jgi:hypothetical protein
MSSFQTRSTEFQKQLADAARWMMRRNAGHEHYWQWRVLTSANSDRDAGRPNFVDDVAREVFRVLEERKLLARIPGTEADPAYLMVYDTEGWEKAVAEGDAIRGFLMKARRKWWVWVLSWIATFALGLVAGVFKDELIGKGKDKNRPDVQKDAGK